MKKRRVLCLAACICLLTAACNDKKTDIEVTMASSQDADGYIYKAVNETVYALRDTNIRTQSTAKSDSLGILEQGESITRIAYNYSWSKVEYDGKICYMSSQYLSTDPASQLIEEESDEEESGGTAR